MIPATTLFRAMPAPELVTLELARLFQTSTEWERRFRHYDRLQDAGLSCEEAARVVCDAHALEHQQDIERAA